MDPNVTLVRALSTSRMILSVCDQEDGDNTSNEVGDLAQQLAENVQDLHAWLIKGGFLPDIWERSRPVRTPAPSGRGTPGMRSLAEALEAATAAFDAVEAEDLAREAAAAEGDRLAATAAKAW